MPFTSGDHVQVANLGRGVVREVRSNGRYVVELKGRSMVLAESLLSTADDRKHRPMDPDAAKAGDLVGPPVRAHARDTIDLHGMTAAEAAEALDAFLNIALLAGLAEVRVIHGRSGGRLKAAVHQRLRGISSIRTFRVDPANPGVTIVAL
ncbi:MAG: Smr/MutS family protein [Acidobacteria bacterium]|nr:Smr/MutS family protein [Acidobacteriota bacterium]